MPITLSPSDSDTRRFKVAAVQAEPYDPSFGYLAQCVSSSFSVWLDLQGGVEKAIRIIKEAAAEGAKIIGFPEVFIPGNEIPHAKLHYAHGPFRLSVDSLGSKLCRSPTCIYCPIFALSLLIQSL